MLVACGAQHSAWQIAFGEVQRQAILNDPKWQEGSYDDKDPPVHGQPCACEAGSSCLTA